MSEPTDTATRPLFMVAAFCVMLLRLIQPTIPIPDGYELATMGECLWLAESDWVDCDEVNLAFRPVAPAIFMGPLLIFFKSISALAVLCTLSLLLFFYALARTLAPFLRTTTLTICLSSLVLLPQSRYLLSIIDARVLALGPLFMAFFWISRVERSPARNMVIGLCTATAALCRPEQMMSVAFIALWVWGLSVKSVVFRLIGLLVPIFAWVGYLSAKAQQLIFSPRHWEGWLLMQDSLPLKWRQQLYGMGIWNPPLRETAMGFPAPKDLDAGLSTSEAIDWMQTHVFDWPLIALSLGILLGAPNLLKKGKHLWIFLAIMVPSLVAAIYPQARDPLFPDSNAVPLVVCLCVLGTTGFALRIRSIFGSQPRFTPMFVAMALVAVAVLSPARESLPQIHKTEAGRAFIEKQNSQGVSTVLASFESAPLLYYTPQTWQQLPSPFEHRAAASFLIYSHLDVNQLTPDPRINGKSSTLVEIFTGENDGSWILLYRLEPETH